MKVRKRISTPEKLNEHLQATSPVTWILLGAIILCLFGFFIWSFTANITYKLQGTAVVSDGVITFECDEARLKDIEVGQKVIIDGSSGEVTSITDGDIKVSINDLNDGEYQYTIILKTIHPIEYLTGK